MKVISGRRQRQRQRQTDTETDTERVDVIDLTRYFMTNVTYIPSDII